MNIEEFPEFLKCKDVAEILNTSLATVSRLLNKKIINGVRSFGGWKIPKDELKRVIDRELNRQKIL
ncbi:MAG: helix-turn-helix domain-containing protein [Pseudobdellovibrionaceae bacterium]